MSELTRSPWFPVTLGIIGLVMGYSFVVFQQENVFAAAEYCPADYLCQGEQCDKTPGCEHGKCSEECSGNCPQHS